MNSVTIFSFFDASTIAICMCSMVVAMIVAAATFTRGFWLLDPALNDLRQIEGKNQADFDNALLVKNLEAGEIVSGYLLERVESRNLAQ